MFELIVRGKQIMRKNYITTVGISLINIVMSVAWQSIAIIGLAYLLGGILKVDWMALALGMATDTSMSAYDLFVAGNGSVAINLLAGLLPVFIISPITVGVSGTFLTLFRKSPKGAEEKIADITIGWAFSCLSDYKRLVFGMLIKQLLLTLASLPYYLMYFVYNLLWYFTEMEALSSGLGSTLAILARLFMYASLILQLVQAVRLMFTEYILYDDKTSKGVDAAKRSMAIMKDKIAFSTGISLMLRYVLMSYLSIFTFGLWYIFSIGPYMGVAFSGFYDLWLKRKETLSEIKA